MSRKNFMKLFSVLLCASTLFSGCNSSIDPVADNNSVSDSTSEVVTPVPAPVEGKLSNYLTMEYEQGWNDIAGNNDALLTKVYGELISRVDYLYAFKKSEKDFENNVTETYTVYNARLNKVVLEKKNTYPDSNYGEYVHDEKCKDFVYNCDCQYLYEKRIPTEVYVYLEIIYIGDHAVHGIMVRTDTNTQIAEDVIYEERLPDGYQESSKWEIFDSYGQAVMDSVLPIERSQYSYNGNTGLAKVVVGDTVALVNLEEDKVVETWSTTTAKHSDYDYANDKYYYYLQAEYGFGAVEVYDKESNLVVRYEHMMDTASGYEAYVLQNGNVLIQTVEANINDEQVDVHTSILDVETGKLTEVEFDYKLKDFLYTNNLADNMSLTQNAVNVALAGEILEDGEFGEYKMVFFDNSLNIQFVYDKLIPEQGYTEVSILKTGDYLVKLDTPITDADRAIVTKEGKVRCYVPVGAKIIENRIVIAGNGDENNFRVSFFNFDLEYIGEFDLRNEDDEYNKVLYTYEGRIGTKYIFTKTSRSWNNDELFWNEEVKELCICDVVSGHTSYAPFEVVSIDDNQSYAIVYDENEGVYGKYKLYDADWNCILVTENIMDVNEYDGNYIVTTWLEDNQLVYAFTSNNVAFDDKGGNE